MKKILFIGGVNSGNSPKGGEEYKNQLLLRRLSKEYKLKLFDTYNWKKKPLLVVRLIISILFFSYDKIIISASAVSSYRLIKFMYYCTRKQSSTIYFVIGGYFPKGILNRRFDFKYYKNLNNIILEGNSLRDMIKDRLGNTSVLPNFKDFDFNVERNISPKESEFRFVFLSRITKSKGVDLIFSANKILRNIELKSNYQIHFYGDIDKGYFEEFKSELDGTMIYKGYLDIIAQPKSSYKALSNYDCMLFPTYWYGEGFPGVLIDAFISGLPVIATDWNMNSEIVSNEKTGLMINIHDEKALADSMIRIMEDESLLSKLSENAKVRAKEYHIDHLWPNVKALIEY